MIRFINYLKFVGIFIIIELALTFIMSLLNLLGVSSGITSLIIFVSNIIIFIILNILNSKTKKKNGYLEGLLLGIIFILVMILIKVILFSSPFTIATLIYYLILLVASIFGGMIGINKKNDSN